MSMSPRTVSLFRRSRSKSLSWPTKTHSWARGGVHDLHGPAGTCALFNVAALHTATTRPTNAERKTVQIYYGHRGRAPLANDSSIPATLWRDHADPETPGLLQCAETAAPSSTWRPSEAEPVRLYRADLPAAFKDLDLSPHTGGRDRRRAALANRGVDVSVEVVHAREEAELGRKGVLLPRQRLAVVAAVRRRVGIQNKRRRFRRVEVLPMDLAAVLR